LTGSAAEVPGVSALLNPAGSRSEASPAGDGQSTAERIAALESRVSGMENRMGETTALLLELFAVVRKTL
jgi:hypothetical protein